MKLALLRYNIFTECQYPILYNTTFNNPLGAIIF